jgi:peptidyl-dipeptidase A
MPIQRVALAAVVLALACRADAARAPGSPELDNFLSGYAREYQRLNYASSLAEWESNTHIVEGDSSNAIRTRQANEALARFVAAPRTLPGSGAFWSIATG